MGIMSWFTEKVLLGRPELVFLVTGKDGGRRAWYYIRVRKPRLEAFKRALGGNQIHLKQYGEILYSGFRRDPPEQIGREFAAKYRGD